jgi:hypothetical protein
MSGSKIFRERNGLPRFPTPVFCVIAENFRVGEAKTVNALLHVADQKTVRTRAVA